MSEIKDGGPAFPVECDWIEGQPQGRQTASHAGWHEGMSLRDYFAAKAMAAFIVGVESFDEAMLATAAYRMADIMLKARGQS